MSKRKCAWCGKFIKQAGNHKFCSQLHRNRYSYRKHNRKEWQRQYTQKRLIASGKELLQCLICGRWFRQVGSHIAWVHKMTAREYREEYGFDVKRGQLPQDLRELYGSQVFENNTVRNLKRGKKFWFKKGQAGVGLYKRSKQTMDRLKLNSKDKWKPRKEKKSPKTAKSAKSVRVRTSATMSTPSIRRDGRNTRSCKSVKIAGRQNP